ncbi:PPK2 domain-containing protein [Acetobacteraceae bacterium EV16G]|uniref:PPK2 domain-containing protein n=1 Tax=Sorlinia euscelidii TaxID=3081148 RepID=A0ABU7U051_9PROT
MLTDKEARQLSLKYRIEDGKTFNLRHFDPAEHGDFSKHDAKAWMRKRKKRLAAFQEAMAAGKTQSVLMILQGMDAAGKDGVIRHVMGGINPQGARVSGFKQPTPVERDHGYLWRVSRATPLLGEIGIFNRSYYEDVLVARVHKENLDRRGLAGNPDDPTFWDDRLRDIRHFETYLHRQNVHIVKIMLHISPEEQQRRLLRRLERPEKLWKFSASDFKERGYWNAYQDAYAAAIAGSATAQAPWYVVPSDKKWFSRLIVLEALIDVFERHPPRMPEAAPEIVKNLEVLKKALKESEIPKKGITRPEKLLPAMNASRKRTASPGRKVLAQKVT